MRQQLSLCGSDQCATVCSLYNDGGAAGHLRIERLLIVIAIAVATLQPC